MKKIALFLAFLGISATGFFTGCDGRDRGGIIIKPEDPDPFLIKLKEMTVSTLSGTLYSFIYNDEGKPSTIDYSSGNYKYVLQYENNRLSSMTNTMNDDRLVYEYNGKNVTAIEIFSGADGKRTSRHEFGYNQSNRITLINEYIIVGEEELLHERKVEIHYNNEGNIEWYKSIFADTNNELTLVSTYTFSDYDNIPNVEPSSLLRSTLGDLLYLPGVQLQKNNPRKLHITSEQTESEISFSFTYSNNLPQEKITRIKQIRGNEPGQVKTNVTAYTYY